MTTVYIGKMLSPRQTYKNSYDQVLFVEGRCYKVVDEDYKYIYLLNELHTETFVRKKDIDEFWKEN